MAVTKVLLVEDDPDDRELFVNFFEDRNDIILLPSVGNGLELIEYLQSAVNDDEKPDLIVLDHNMPKMNGKQTLEYLMKHEQWSKIPTVIYSTYTDTNLIVDCKKLNARVVASKPIDGDGYHKMMNDFLEAVKYNPVTKES